MSLIQSPIAYILQVQRIAISLVLCSILAIIVWLFFFDPTDSFFVLASFLILWAVLIAASFVLLSFWWYFSVQKHIVSVSQVHKIIGQSCISSTILITLAVMQQTQQLNVVTFAILVGTYILYQLWAASDGVSE